MLSIRKGLVDNTRWVFFGGAMDPESYAALRALAGDTDPGVRRAVAQNESTPADLLRALAFDSDGDVRAGAVRNPSTPEDIVRLAVMRAQASGAEVDVRVRASAAANPSAPVDVLRILASDDDQRVRTALIATSSSAHDFSSKPTQRNDERDGNSECTREDENTSVAHQSLRSTSSRLVRGERLGADPSTPVNVLQSLANDWNPLTRAAVAGNPSTPMVVRLTLASDGDARVRKQVAANIFDVLVAGNPEVAEGPQTLDPSTQREKQSNWHLRPPSLELPND